MEFFEKQINDVYAYMARENAGGTLSFYDDPPAGEWPSEKNRNIVLAGDMAVELGNPSQESAALLLWTEQKGRVHPGRISLVGPELRECEGESRPFGKVVLAEVRGFDENNSYDRYREMEGVRYDLDLKGYMLRAASQYQREWSRVSREALRDGFSLRFLGASLISRLTALDYVDAAEILFVTSGREDVLELKKIAAESALVINAMNKIVEEFSHDCATCDYASVCSDVEALRRLRKVHTSSSSSGTE